MVNHMKHYIESLIEREKREDQRGLLDYRHPITIETGISSNTAEGSARVKIGDTEVVAGIKLDIGTPYPDTPDEGAIMVDVELIPLSSPEFESGPPNIDAVELARIIDRGIRESHCIDMPKLCIKKGEKVWMVFMDVYPINDDGNLLDASFLAVLAALRDARFPEHDQKTEHVTYTKRTTKKVPLTCDPM